MDIQYRTQNMTMHWTGRFFSFPACFVSEHLHAHHFFLQMGMQCIFMASPAHWGFGLPWQRLWPQHYLTFPSRCSSVKSSSNILIVSFQIIRREKLSSLGWGWELLSCLWIYSAAFSKDQEGPDIQEEDYRQGSVIQATSTRRLQSRSIYMVETMLQIHFFFGIINL